MFSVVLIMKKKTPKKSFLRQLTPPKIFISLFIVAALVILAIVLPGRFKKEAPISEGQIQIKKGDRIVTVNENGLIEYRTDERVYYETWDSSKISSFFQSMENKARAYLGNPAGPIEGGYEVTLYLDGKIVTIYLSGDDEELNEVFDGFSDGPADGDLSSYFDGGTENDSSNSSGNSTSSSESGLLTPTPTGAPSSGSGGTVQTVPDCTLYGQLITGKTVISNTICVGTSQP